jgi:hypothetical protein
MLIQSITLSKLIRRGNFKEGIKIMVMFLLSNLAFLIMTVSEQVLIENLKSSLLVVVYPVAISLLFGFYGLAQWMFSFEYYNMVRIIPFVLNEIPPPESIHK